MLAIGLLTSNSRGMLTPRRGISKMHDRDSILQLLDVICAPKKYNFVYMPGRSHAGLAIVNFVDAQACHQCFLALRQMQELS